MKQIYNAIVFFEPNKEKRPRKYRNISHLENFAKFAEKEGAWYMNIYFAKTSKFWHRRYLRNDF